MVIETQDAEEHCRWWYDEIIVGIVGLHLFLLPILARSHDTIEPLRTTITSNQNETHKIRSGILTNFDNLVSTLLSVSI